MFGHSGNCLQINLTKQTYSNFKLPQEILQKFLGGRGLGVYLLYKDKDIIDPLNENSRIILSVGPLTNTKVPTSGRSNLSYRSPLTGLITDANAGGRLGVNIKGCGYDAIIIEGKAKYMQILHITKNGVQFINAEGLRQKTTSETQDYLKQKFGTKCSTALIGPAGENGVLFSTVSVDGKRNFGRGGAGAVWGAKNLKAIVVDGELKTNICDEEKFEFFLNEIKKQISAHPITSKALPEFGTSMLVNVINAAGALPAYNFQENFTEDAKNVSGEVLSSKYLTGRYACFNCPIACGRKTIIENREEHGPEYETIYALGTACGIFNLQSIIMANYLCNLLGLDTISTGVTIACAMEMYQKGYITEKISFGDSNVQSELIQDIAYKKGIGAKLANGSKKFAEEYGHPEIAMHVKGLELPAYDPRAAQAQGLAYATSNRGGCHLRANMAAPEILGVPKMIDREAVHGKAGLLIVMQHSAAIFDSLILCKFAGFALTEEFLARILTAVCGINFEPMDLQKIGERIWNAERIFNLRAGLNPWQDDTLPNRLLNETAKKGPSSGKIVNLKPMLEEYYRFRSWDTQGIPTKEKLTELGLEL